MGHEGIRFVAAGEAKDPLQLDHLQRALEAAGIRVLVEDRGTGPVSGLTDGLTLPWWLLRVPEADRQRAEALIQQELAGLESHAAEDARAAEEEAEAAAQGAGSTTSHSA